MRKTSAHRNKTSASAMAERVDARRNRAGCCGDGVRSATPRPTGQSRWRRSPATPASASARCIGTSPPGGAHRGGVLHRARRGIAASADDLLQRHRPVPAFAAVDGPVCHLRRGQARDGRSLQAMFASGVVQPSQTRGRHRRCGIGPARCERAGRAPARRRRPRRRRHQHVERHAGSRSTQQAARLPAS